MTQPHNGHGAAPAAQPIDQRVEDGLSALGALAATAPPLGDALARELESLRPVKPRVPARQLAGVLALSLLYAGGLVAFLGVRPDLSGLPRLWLGGFIGVWLASFATITWLVLVPARGRVMPRWRWAAATAALAALLLVAGGLLLPRSVPGRSLTYDPSVASVLHHAGGCLTWGLIAAVVPAVLAALAVRGAVPVGTRTVAAALGAAGGAVGGLVLQLHCPITERYHLGLVHGGVVVLAALVAALAASVRVATTRSPSG